MYVFLQDLIKIKSQTFIGIDTWKLFLAFLVFAIIALASGILSNLITGLLRKILGRVEETVREKFLREIKPCLKILFFVIAVWAGFYILGVESIFAIINRLVRTFTIFIGIWTIYRAVDIIIYFLKQVVSRTDPIQIDYLTIFIGKVLKFVVIALGIVMFIQELGYDATSIIAGLGVGGLAIALAGKDFVENIFGFFTIFMDRSFAVGDWISTPDAEGTVEDLGMRSTRVRTINNTLVTIPNSALAHKKIDNFAKIEKRYLAFKLRVAYSSSADQLEELCKTLREYYISHEGIYEDSILIYLTDFSDSSIDISISCYTKSPEIKNFLELQHEAKLKTMRILEELDMEMAFPSRSLYFENLDSQTMKIMDQIKDKQIVS